MPFSLHVEEGDEKRHQIQRHAQAHEHAAGRAAVYIRWRADHDDALSCSSQRGRQDVCSNVDGCFRRAVAATSSTRSKAAATPSSCRGSKASMSGAPSATQRYALKKLKATAPAGVSEDSKSFVGRSGKARPSISSTRWLRKPVLSRAQSATAAG